MNENIELLNYIHENCNMGVTSLTNLINELNGKDNKIKKLVEEQLKGYESFVKRSENLLKEHDQKPKTNNLMAEMSSWMGIKMDMLKDNSDAKVADLLTKGFTMGTVDITKKINNYEKDCDKEILKLAKELLKFSEDNIELLKKYL